MLKKETRLYSQPAGLPSLTMDRNSSIAEHE